MSAACGAITLEIVRGAARAVQVEMGAPLERTVMSAFISQKTDFYTALFDGDDAIAAAVTCRPSEISWERAPKNSRSIGGGRAISIGKLYGSRGTLSHSNDQVFLAPLAGSSACACLAGCSWQPPSIAEA